MVLGDVNRTRRLAGNPSVTNVSDADITQGLSYGTAEVKRYTGKSDWETDTTHSDYPAVVTAAEYFASSYIRDRFNDQEQISDEHYKRAKDICQRIAESLSSSAAGGSAVVFAEYRSNPLNPDAPIYRSISPGGGTLVGVDTGPNA